MNALNDAVLVLGASLAGLILWDKWKQRSVVRCRRIHLRENLDLIVPYRGTARYLTYSGADLQEAKNDPRIPINDQDPTIEIESVYDLPRLFCDRDRMERWPDYIVRASDGKTIRFVLDQKACAWRTYEPLKEKFA